MRKPVLALFTACFALTGAPLKASAQAEPPAYVVPSDDDAATSHLTSLPTNRSFWLERDREFEAQPLDPSFGSSQPPQHWTGPPPADPAKLSPVDYKKLLRPRVKLQAEWEPSLDGLGICSYDASAQMPVYPILGPPPPFITAGYSFTTIDSPAAFDLPDSLHDMSLGLAWMRKINKRWMARFMFNAAYASDLNNSGSDAWQFRGGGFAIYRPNERWTWAIGAMATGRDDLPVIPAVGAIWEPSPELKIDLMLPNPKISLLLADSGKRQHRGYVGGGFTGGTWAYERAGGLDERVTYREWRLVLGWESSPPRPPGTFGPQGTTFNAELGYAFGRQFEFDSNAPSISPDGTLLLSTGISF